MQHAQPNKNKWKSTNHITQIFFFVNLTWIMTKIQILCAHWWHGIPPPMKYNNGDSPTQNWFAKNIWPKNNGQTPPHALEKSSKTFRSPNNLKSPKHVVFLLVNSVMQTTHDCTFVWVKREFPNIKWKLIPKWKKSTSNFQKVLFQKIV